MARGTYFSGRTVSHLLVVITFSFCVDQANAKLADALGADWGQLMAGSEVAGRRGEEGGEARRRWSGPEIIRRIGISRWVPRK